MIRTHIESVKVSATLEINHKSALLKAQGIEVYRLGFGQSPFPVPAQVVESLKQHAHKKDYLPVKGLQELRGAVANWCSEKLKVRRNAENVLIGPGSKELIFILQTVLSGDLILPAPSWVSYSPQANILSKKVHWLEPNAEGHWNLDTHKLDKLCQQIGNCQKLLILNYPNNPTGASYDREILREIAEVVRKHSVVVLSDEIYGEVHHTGDHCSIAEFYEEGTIISTGISKWCGAGGWRLGAFIFPRQLKSLLDQMAVVASETYTSASAPIQFAAVRAYEGGSEIDLYLKNSRRILSVIGNYVFERLKALNIETQAPIGGFYLFPNFEHYRGQLSSKGINSSMDLCNRLLEETGIALLPGVDFGLQSEALYARLSYVDFNGEFALDYALNHSLDSDEKIIKIIAPKVHAALEKLELWLNN